MYIKVRVLTQQRKESVEQLKENAFKIYLKEKAERNLANTRLVELLALYFKLPKQKIRIINGHHSPSKLLAVDV